MTQKTGKEETELKLVPETITLCVNNCGVTGNPAANNMCQKCFSATTAAAGSSSAAIHYKFDEKQPRSGFKRLSPERTSPDLKRREDRTVAIGEKTVEDRCSGCRYSDRHDCIYYYEAAGQDAIAKEANGIGDNGDHPLKRQIYPFV